jgi:hypothetical protein
MIKLMRANPNRRRLSKPNNPNPTIKNLEAKINLPNKLK